MSHWWGNDDGWMSHDREMAAARRSERQGRRAAGGSSRQQQGGGCFVPGVCWGGSTDTAEGCLLAAQGPAWQCTWSSTAATATCRSQQASTTAAATAQRHMDARSGSQHHLLPQCTHGLVDDTHTHPYAHLSTPPPSSHITSTHLNRLTAKRKSASSGSGPLARPPNVFRRAPLARSLLVSQRGT